MWNATAIIGIPFRVLQVLIFALLGVSAHAAEDFLDIEGWIPQGRSPTLSGVQMWDAQAYALAFALASNEANVIRGRFSPGNVDAPALRAHGFSVPNPADWHQKVLGLVSDRPTFDESAQFGVISWPTGLSVALGVGYSVKHQAWRPVCIIQKVHEVRIPKKSKGNLPVGDYVEFMPEVLPSLMDPMHRHIEPKDMESILVVVPAPEDDPFVLHLREVLGPEWEIVMQAMPCGRPGLSTLAMWQVWAGVISLQGTSRSEEVTEQVIASQIPPPMPSELVLNLPVNYHLETLLQTYRMFYQLYHDKALAMRGEPYPLRQFELPGFGQVSIPANYAYGSIDELWAVIRSGRIEEPAEESRNTATREIITRALAFSRLESELQPGSRLYQRFMVDYDQLPMPIQENRIAYTLPVEIMPAQWKEMILNSPWKDRFDPQKYSLGKSVTIDLAEETDSEPRAIDADAQADDKEGL